jgi:hypothetical protein
MYQTIQMIECICNQRLIDKHIRHVFCLIDKDWMCLHMLAMREEPEISIFIAMTLFFLTSISLYMQCIRPRIIPNESAIVLIVLFFFFFLVLSLSTANRQVNDSAKTNE